MFESDGAQIISEPRPAGLGELDDALGDLAKGKWQLLQSELVTNDELVSNKQQMLDGGRAMDEGIGSSDNHSDVDTHSSGESENSHCMHDPSDEVVMLSDDAETRGRGRIESPVIRKRAAPDFQPAACSCHAAKMPAGRYEVKTETELQQVYHFHQTRRSKVAIIGVTTCCGEVCDQDCCQK